MDDKVDDKVDIREAINKMKVDINEAINKIEVNKEDKVDISEAINKIEFGSFVVNTTKVFSEQVTDVCIVTLRPLFDVDKARAIREFLKRSFDAVIEVIDEEIEEFGVGEDVIQRKD